MSRSVKIKNTSGSKITMQVNSRPTGEGTSKNLGTPTYFVYDGYKYQHKIKVGKFTCKKCNRVFDGMSCYSVVKDNVYKYCCDDCAKEEHKNSLRSMEHKENVSTPKTANNSNQNYNSHNPNVAKNISKSSNNAHIALQKKLEKNRNIVSFERPNNMSQVNRNHHDIETTVNEKKESNEFVPPYEFDFVGHKFLCFDGPLDFSCDVCHEVVRNQDKYYVFYENKKYCCLSCAQKILSGSMQGIQLRRGTRIYDFVPDKCPVCNSGSFKSLLFKLMDDNNSHLFIWGRQCNGCEKYSYATNVTLTDCSGYNKKRPNKKYGLNKDLPKDSDVFQNEKTNLRFVVEELDTQINDYGRRMKELDRTLRKLYDDYKEQKEELEYIKKIPYIAHIQASLVGSSGSKFSRYITEHNVVKTYHNNKIVVIPWMDSSVAAFYSPQHKRIKGEFGQEYELEYKRNIIIKNSELESVNTVYDFETNPEDDIVNPFLMDILKDRGELKNIIRTIQAEQYDIMSNDGYKNFVVQGCAGSGKTMVLLHRLAYVDYNVKDIDLDQMLVVTPNTKFNNYIKGVTDSLRLTEVEKISSGMLYVDLVSKYNPEYSFKPLSSDLTVKTEILREIYSVNFADKIAKNFSECVSKVYGMTEFQEFIKLAGLEIPDNHDWNQVLVKNAAKKIEDIIYINEHDNKLISDNEAELIKISNNLRAVLFRKGILENELQEARDKVVAFISRKIIELDKKCDQLDSDKKSIERKRFITAVDRRNLTQLTRETASLKSKKTILEKSRVEINKMGKDFKVIAKAAAHGFVEILDQINQYNKNYSDYRNYTAGYRNEFDKYEKIKSENEQIKKRRLSNDALSRVKQLYACFIKITSFNNFVENCVNKEVMQLCKKYGVKLEDKTYRFTAYLLLLTCKLYYPKLALNYKLVSIDESQDLNITELRLIKEVMPNECAYNLYGDVEQIVYNYKGISNWNDVRSIFNEISIFRLDNNYRNSQEITRFCNEYLDKNTRAVGIKGAEVQRFKYGDLSESSGLMQAVLYLAKLCKDNNRVNRVAIIHSTLNHTLRRSLQKIVEGLKHITGTDYIPVMSVEEVKGMEFDSAIVVAKDMSHSEKYISITRALDHLIIVE